MSSKVGGFAGTAAAFGVVCHMFQKQIKKHEECTPPTILSWPQLVPSLLAPEEPAPPLARA